MTHDPTDPATITFVRVYTDDEGYTQVVHSDESAIDAAVTRWIDSGETRDTLLDLTMLCGDSHKLRASSIVSWIVSTPEGRARQREIDAAFKAETAWDEEE